MQSAAPVGEVVSLPRAIRSESGDLPALIRHLSAARSPEEVMAAVTQAVRSLLQADGATFVLRDGGRCFYAEEDAISPLWKGRKFPLGDCVSGWCMVHGETVAIPDIYKDPRVPTEAYRPTFVRSMAMAPVGQDEPMAALGAYWSDRRQIEPQQLELLQTIANAAALALAASAPLGTEAEHASGPIAKAAPTSELDEPSSIRHVIARFRRDGIRPGSLEAYGIALLTIAAAALARSVAGKTGLPTLTPFTTFYPAVLLTVLLGGGRAGAVAAVIGGLFAYLAFLPPPGTQGQIFVANLFNLASFYLATGLIVWMVDRYQTAVARLKAEDARHLTLAREQHHRVLNATHIIELIVRQSLKDEPARARLINQRIRAGLAEVDLRGRTAAQPIAVRKLLLDELQPFGLERIGLEGPDHPLLPPNIRSIVSLAAHELATNALKYGALSNNTGRIAIAWSAEEGGVSLIWGEAGGPPVRNPKRRGYGSVLLQRLVEAAGGSLAIQFNLGGVEAKLFLPL